MLGRRISKHVVGTDEDVTIIMDDSGSDSPHSTDSCEVDTSRHRLLDGNQTSDASDYAATEGEGEKTGHNPPGRGASMRQSVQADSTLRTGHPSVHGRSGTQKAPLAGVEMSDMLKPESRVSSLGLGVTPSASAQDLTEVQQGNHQTPARGQSASLGARTGSARQLPSSASFDDFGDLQRQRPAPTAASVPPSPFLSASPFVSPSQQDRAVPDPSAPVDTSTQAQHPLDRTPSFQSGRITRWWGKFDAQYMQPVFGGPAPPSAGDPLSDAASAPAAHAVIDPHAPVDPGAK